MRFYKFLIGSLVGLTPLVFAIGFLKEGVRLGLESASAPIVLGGFGVGAVVYALYRMRRRSLRASAEWIENSLGI